MGTEEWPQVIYKNTKIPQDLYHEIRARQRRPYAPMGRTAHGRFCGGSGKNAGTIYDGTPCGYESLMHGVEQGKIWR